MTTAYTSGYECGIMRQLPKHPYLPGTTPAREFMTGFQSGCNRRAWLDARGQKRSRTKVTKSDGGWHWEAWIENTIVKQGWSTSQKKAETAGEEAILADLR